MAKPWEKQKASPKRGSIFSIGFIIKLFVAYVAYLAIWKCPVTQPLHCSCVPCATLHSIYDTQLAPIWEEHGAPYYAKVEPYAGPVWAKIQPYGECAKTFVTDHIDQAWTHIDPKVQRVKESIEPRLEPLKPHWTLLQDYYAKAKAAGTPHLTKASNFAWTWLQRLWSQLQDLFTTHAAPYLSLYLRKADEHNARLFEKATLWINGHYHSVLSSAHSYLTEKLSRTASPTLAATDATFASTLELETPTPDILSSEHVEASSTVASDFISTSTAVSASYAASQSLLSRSASALRSQEEAKTLSSIVSSLSSVKASSQSKTVEAATASSSSSPSSRPGTDWLARIARTAKGAKKNLNSDAQEFQEKLVAEAKPGIMMKLRKISRAGDDAVLELTHLTSDIEQEKKTFDNEMELFDNYDEQARKLHELLMEVRTDCEALAQNVIDKIAEVRKDALESLDDFFEIVLLEAGKTAASGDEEDEWQTWQAYSKLKKQIQTVRQEVELYEPEMDTINTALRESQQAAILLTQEFNGHIRTLRARTQFFVQQKALLESKQRGDDIDADWYDETHQEVVADTAESAPESAPEQVPEPAVAAGEKVNDAADPQPVDEFTQLEDLNDDEAEIDEETLTHYVTETIYSTRINTHAE